MGNSFSGENSRLIVSPGLRGGEFTIDHQGRRPQPIFRTGEGRHAR
ncbi:hypothetical protein [Zavarzinia aquatilis]|nr:hypothetical protein [Zavarzinia aquatilis]